eukprot:TRINITY_DN30729_c0_g1_i2.p1 TRINITY_DN30729_c0_g1~~TRINITY_DN30729_c0_g1_i2.p1  ORF type:complete len:392 (-),score=31.36 TRINITY_DN30729_c0_g1_i2:506-1561(-)
MLPAKTVTTISWRLVVLLVITIAFLILLIHVTFEARKPDFGCAPIQEEFINTQEPSDNDQYVELPSYTGGPVSAPNKITFLMPSYQRNQLLLKQLEYYEKCDIIHEFIFIWTNDHKNIPTNQTHPELFNFRKKIRFENSVDDVPGGWNNRFIPIRNIETEAVFTKDDDVYIPCYGIHRVYNKWVANARKQIVGVFPRDYSTNEHCELGYELKWTTYGRQQYSMILAKGAIFTRDYLEMYWKWLPQAYRDFVDKQMMCEDILMNFMVANITRQPPILVKVPWIIDVGSGVFAIKGISQNTGHQRKRGECLNVFSQLNGGQLPLIRQKMTKEEAWWWTPLVQDIANFLTPFYK